MGRPLLIVGIVGLLIATGVAAAAPAGEVRLPVTIGDTSDQPGTPHETVVRKGDHLWKISALHLDQHSPGLNVAPYWLRVIDVNTPHLRSGDPDLIFPGEVIRLPAIRERP